MQILLTGAAGFIGFHAARHFLARGDEVAGVDNLNDYYTVQLKLDRLEELRRFERFRFMQADVARREFAGELHNAAGDTDLIVHFAAQAGVRYSGENPHLYVDSNVAGQVSVFELAARLPKRPPVVYASSSSVYGAGEPAPFGEISRADTPISIYAATKRAGELLAHAYQELHGVRATGLRFFTVYGRFGRPDMAPWKFSDAILRGQRIEVFNGGKMRRDFTHIDDVVAGVAAAADRILAQPRETERVYNLGNNNPVDLLDFIAIIERAAGRKAMMEMKPKPPGDVELTFADIRRASRDLGFRPKVPLEQGMTDFVSWYRAYAGL